MPAFDAHMAAVDAAVNASFGEPVLITPRLAAGNYGVSTDPNRAVVATVGVVSISPVAADMKGLNKSGDMIDGRTTAVAEAEIWFAASVASVIGYGLKAGDTITLVSRPGAPVYKVSRPARTDLGDVAVMVTLDR